MFNSSIQTIEQFKEVLLELPEACFSQSCDTLSNTSIGQHTRHVIELYQCLLEGYTTEQVYYDKRKRNKRIEEDLSFAIEQLEYIQKNLVQPDKQLKVIYELEGRDVSITSNYNREVMYNLEHLIHHQALIKVGVVQLTDILLCETFGVAPSTVKFKKHNMTNEAVKK